MPLRCPGFWTRSVRSPWVPWGLGLIAISADQAVKVYAESSFLVSPPIPTMADHRAVSEVLFLLGTPDSAFLRFDLTHVANAGVMLGALEEAPSPVPWLAFMTATAIGLGIAVGLFRAAKSQEAALRAGALVLAAGILGNLVDRLRLGYVVDWAHVQWRWFGWHYSAPAFNLADLFIILGATLAGAALACRWATNRGHLRVRSSST